MFDPNQQIPRNHGRPASTTPLHDYFAAARHPGVDVGYAVLPWSLIESMPLGWQHQMTQLLSEFHQAFAHLHWPIYRVVPSRPERLVDLDEEQLAQAGFMVELDASGELVYRDRSGQRVQNPEDRTVLTPCLDPILNQNHTPNPAPRPQPHP